MQAGWAWTMAPSLWIEPVRLADDQAAVGAHPGLVLALGAAEHVAGTEQAGFDDLAERDARLGLLGAHHVEVGRGDRATLAIRASARAA